MAGTMATGQIAAVSLLALAFGAVPAASAGPAVPSAATRQLIARNAEFSQAIIKVAPNVYVADGYGVSPLTMVIGTDGYFLVDTGVDVAQSRLVRAEFEKLTGLPLKAIIFTHGHNDHVTGAPAFLTPGQAIDIWAARNFGSEDRWQEAAGLRIQNLRGLRQSGMALPDAKRINNGVAKAFRPERRPGQARPADAILPNKFVDTQIETIIAGVKVVMVRSQGETDDTITVWLPDQRVVFAGDNFYKSWPNAPAIRGTGYRDVLAWAQSIDAMKALKPAVLVGGHTKPIVGAAEVDSVLGNYARGIRYIFDETIKGMNEGKSAEELAATIRLPADLAALDYLKPYYGNPEWTIKSIFTAYLGWFDGNPTNLFRLPPKAEAQRLIALAGGEARVRREMSRALQGGDWQWATELLDRLLALNPQDQQLRNLKADALEALAEQLLTATGRNYYLSYAQELRSNPAAGPAPPPAPPPVPPPRQR